MTTLKSELNRIPTIYVSVSSLSNAKGFPVSFLFGRNRIFEGNVIVYGVDITTGTTGTTSQWTVDPNGSIVQCFCP